MRSGRWLSVIAAGCGLAGGAARADAPAVPPFGAAPAVGAPAPPPVRPRALEESAAVALRDDRGARVTLRVPAALHRPANAYRLYGLRPFTLRSRNRRRDLYRDALIAIATRSALAPPAAPGIPSGAVDLLKPPPGLALPGGDAVAALRRRLRDLPGGPGGALWARGNFQALTRALGALAPGTELSQPVAEALRLRALATDAAEQRLRTLGALLGLSGGPAPGADPALVEGYQAAVLEFAQVRQGVWPAVADSLQRNQGRLALSALKEIVLSRLGFWAVFGYVGWQSAEGAVNAEYHGQYAVCLATVAAALQGAATQDPAALPEALSAELALNYELTEALKAGQVMPLKPAGGRGDAEWQIYCAERCAELRRALWEG